uniref:Protein kinase domain-containing protein n=1 Tax=Chenopodium quinoa TaxID=63459 RepID=A0A803KUA7_CHEQI
MVKGVSRNLGYYRVLIFFIDMMVAMLPFSLQIVSETTVFNTSSQIAIALPNCPEKCGDTQIPYPFGIGENCHYKHPKDGIYYSVTCNTSTSPPSLIYGDSLEVTNITLEGNIWVRNFVAYDCFNYTEEMHYKQNTSVRMNRFVVSTTQNSLVAIGCDTYVWFNSVGITNSSTQYHSGCMTTCNEEQGNSVGSMCSGIGCCRAFIPNGVYNVSVQAKSFYNHSYVVDFNPCSIAFVVANDAMPSPKEYLPKNFAYVEKLKLPMVYNWSIGTKDCLTAQAAEEPDYICKGNSTCVDLPDERGYRCQCKPGFQGNPYLHGCQGVGGGIIAFFIGALWLYWQHGQRQIKKMKESFFYQNGGHILETKLKRRDISMGSIVKMFTVEEIKKATDNYSVSSIIGRGGFGMVYKGILTNNQVVAIKKSLKVDSSQVEQFINEVIALSHVNHKNVVKLLGCCLETEVPLLVYEYIRNGTLYEHLHDEHKTRLLTWDVRLRIATEVAGVLAYLHTMTTIPIIHRDIKSMNILLDENYIAKVSDFGASKLAPTNQDQLASMIQGTCGYLDPEYLQTGDLTEKSDVYSFGVVLAELLTREKALSYERTEDDKKCLTSYFLRNLKDDRLLEILDDNIKSDGALVQIKEVANLVKRCLKVKGEDRPTMKQVARELEDIKEIGSHPWSDKRGVLLQKESEYLVGEIQVNSNDYNNSITAMNDSSSNSQSRVVSLVPLNDGR